MRIAHEIANEVERMKADGKSPDEVFDRAKQMMRKHNEEWLANRFFQDLLDDAVGLR